MDIDSYSNSYLKVLLNRIIQLELPKGVHIWPDLSFNYKNSGLIFVPLPLTKNRLFLKSIFPTLR